MTGLEEISTRLDPALLLAALVGMGMVGGTLSALFGIGGAVVITPMLNALLGVDYTLAVGSSLCFTLGTSAGGWSRHMRLGNVAVKAAVVLGICSMGGAVLGKEVHFRLRAASGELFVPVMHGLFVIVMLAVARLVWRSAPKHRTGKSAFQRLSLPPRISLTGELTGVSLPALALLGVAAGVLSGLLGIGGGVILVPALLLVVGLGMHQCVGTSLGVIVLTSLAGVVTYGITGQASLWIAMPLLVGSALGVQLGAWICQRLRAAPLRRYFAVLMLATAAYLVVDIIRNLRQAGGG